MSDFRIRQVNSPIRALQRVSDALTICVSLYLAQWAVGQHASQSSIAAIATAVVTYLVSELTGQEASRSSASRALAKILINWSLTILCLALIAFFTRQGEYFARSSIMGWIVLTGSSLGLMHMLFRIGTDVLFSSSWTKRRCAIAGLNELGSQLLSNARTLNVELKLLDFSTTAPRLGTSLVKRSTICSAENWISWCLRPSRAKSIRCS